MEKLSAYTNASQQPLVSIVTACYNSIPFLERVYSSIKGVDYKNIEWIAVDDCSKDNTVEKLLEIKNRNEIRVIVLPLPENTRAFGAVEAGIALASGRFSIILDHDDELLPGAVSAFIKRWEQFSTSGERLYGVWGRCVDENNVLLGKLYPQAPLIGTNQYFFHKLKCRSECSMMIDTELLKQYYTLSPGETVKTNGVVWDEMGKKYRSIFTNEIVRKYYTNIPTSQVNQKKTRMPLEMAKQEVKYLNNNHKVFWNDLFFFLRKIMIYHMYSHYAGISIRASIKKIKYVYIKLIAILLLPLLPVLLLREKIVNK